MTSPFVFIILPVFNGERYILQQLMSIYYQTFKDWYLVIVNDGSTDKTEEIVKDFIENYHLEDKIELLTKKNGGVNMAIETGLIEIKNFDCKGEVFVAYCDADDAWMRNKLEFQINYIRKNKLDLCYHDLVVIDENDNMISNSYNKMLYTPINNIFDNSFLSFCIYNHVTSTTMIFKRDYIEKILPICNGLYQDWYTSLIISGLNGKIAGIDKSLAYYRRHSKSLTWVKNEDPSKFFNEFINVLENIKGRLLKENQEIANYMISYYHERLKHTKNGYYKYFLFMKYPLILKKLIKNIFKYFFHIHE